mmetsp:Transcript_19630/g.27517  ORF Transcript_19630/g.27517 Transcript_19630/m.27517 type:complete len:120 (-) Transcript_19630:179-538(-)
MKTFALLLLVLPVFALIDTCDLGASGVIQKAAEVLACEACKALSPASCDGKETIGPEGFEILKLACVTGEGCSLNPGLGLWISAALVLLLFIGCCCFRRRQIQQASAINMQQMNTVVVK